MESQPQPERILTTFASTHVGNEKLRNYKPPQTPQSGTQQATVYQQERTGVLISVTTMPDDDIGIGPKSIAPGGFNGIRTSSPYDDPLTCQNPTWGVNAKTKNIH